MTTVRENVNLGSRNDEENIPPNSFVPKSPVKISRGKGGEVMESPSQKLPRTPPRRMTEQSMANGNSRLVTPSNSVISGDKQRKDEEKIPSQVRRTLRMDSNPDTDASSSSALSTITESFKEGAVKKNPFGHATIKTPVEILPNVRKVYHEVNKQTGSVGGNGHGGAIYGELTMGSMQKMVELMKEYTGLSSESRFVDVGCGLAKPNIHVAQDPGVAFSYGIEMERVRWALGMANLNQVLRAAQKQIDNETPAESVIGHKCFLAHGDITDAKYFDPFTHVYMFDIGFPPRLFAQISGMWNRSKSEYMICYHGPRLMIDRYEFDLEFLTQAPTSMHGSSEGHTGYIYRRLASTKKKNTKPCPSKHFGELCDPLFKEAWTRSEGGIDDLSEHVAEVVTEHLRAGRPTRTRSKPKKYQDEHL